VAGIRRQVEALFGVLESVGCFLLRKGTVENYYLSANLPENIDKFSTALMEAEALSAIDTAAIRRGYTDIIRALDYAANSPDIDEAAAIRRLLVAVVAVVMDGFDQSSTDIQLNSIARQILGDAASLFELRNVSKPGEEPVLQVNLVSKVLDASGFPAEFTRGCNVNLEAIRQLKKSRSTAPS